MNIFVIQNWYHYDLNKKIINYLKTNKSKNAKQILKERIDYDFKFKIE